MLSWFEAGEANNPSIISAFVESMKWNEKTNRLNERRINNENILFLNYINVNLNRAHIGFMDNSVSDSTSEWDAKFACSANHNYFGCLSL